jgi:hypothetical protein
MDRMMIKRGSDVVLRFKRPGRRPKHSSRWHAGIAFLKYDSKTIVMRGVVRKTSAGFLEIRNPMLDMLP